MRVFEIDGEPVPWARPRFNHGRAFNAEKQAKAKEELSLAIREWWGQARIAKPRAVHVSIEFHFKAQRKCDIGRYKSSRPDIDNLLKQVLDCIQPYICEDDAQVADICVRKMWAEKPKTLISIRSILEDGVSKPRDSGGKFRPRPGDANNAERENGLQSRTGDN